EWLPGHIDRVSASLASGHLRDAGAALPPVLLPAQQDRRDHVGDAQEPDGDAAPPPRGRRVLSIPPDPKEPPRERGRAVEPLTTLRAAAQAAARSKDQDAEGEPRQPRRELADEQSS